ncbi:hypothetical protein GMES_2029 [Paraglaciecola mesophila KMM 241]|uniref:Uncharacterized protein n=1 Tax=Paraglaciecola mesophila KMM 241 TaxID=1128912 RepID=K6ZLU8_9ALTE|nr:hypothetical protein GMES_2029 [Paraglaciecola mesophila KMM 241]
MRVAYFMACGHYALRLSYELRSRSTASLPMSCAHLCALLTLWPAATYGL